MLTCRHCSEPVEQVFVDLGTSPPSNAYLTAEQLHNTERYYPLKVFVCEHCFLVQIEEVKQHHEIFDADYAYFSSISKSWLQHCERYTEMICERLQLGEDSYVVEVASNDGYLLQFFQQRRIPCLGIEPTASTAVVSREKGIEVLERFFGEELATELRDQGRSADLLIGNNVLAHVPDLNGFLRGVCILLKSNGVATFEFPHLVELVENAQFDTIYHEHYSYFSLYTVMKVCESNGLRVFDVERLPTHGGSLRLFVCRGESEITSQEAVEQLYQEEVQKGVNTLAYYTGFQAKVESIKFALWHFLLEAKAEDKQVAGYGAAAKGNTLLNFAGIRGDLLEYVADLSPHKQGKFLPGSRIPIVSPDELFQRKPDVVLILPWNLHSEIVEQLRGIRDWGGSFLVAIPEVISIE